MATQTPASSEDPRVENSIRPSRRRVKAPSETPADTKASSAPASARNATAPERTRVRADAVPSEIRERFVQVKNKYYFSDGTRAFTDRGDRLTTPSENTEVIRSLIAIAQSRGWNEISVRGTERFRKEAWLAARLVGLDARGYKPSEFEQGHLVRTIARKGEPSSPTESDSAPSGGKGTTAVNAVGERRDGLLAGKLLDHGPGPYLQDPHQPMSYFVKVETSRGDRTIWGVDLGRAFKESLTKPSVGDDIGLRAVKQDAVTVKTSERDSEGKVIGQKSLGTHRNRWIVEKRDFFSNRGAAARTLRDVSIEPKQAVQKHPELVGTYLQMHAAKLASKRFKDPEDREKFVAQVRSALADSVARGEPLPPVRLKERAAEPARTPPAKGASQREAIVRG